MTLDEASCSGRKCRNAPDREIGEAGKDRHTGAIRLQFVLPIPDSRRQKAEVQRSVSRPDNVRRGAVAEPRHRPRLGYTGAIQGMVAIGFIRVYLVMAPPKSLEPSDVSLLSPAA